MSMFYPQKINVLCPCSWAHHRGGWTYCVDAMQQLHTQFGTPFYANAIIATIDKAPITTPWMAIMHITKLDHLEEKLNKENWIKSIPWCRGIYVLYKQGIDIVKDSLNIEAETLTHPCALPNLKFDLNRYALNPEKRVIHVGHWLRNPEMICLLKTRLTRTILNCNNSKFNSEVETLNYLPEHEYDQLLSENIIFLNFEAAGASNTVIECIVRNTPVLVNHSPSVEEYLGKDYPLFYNNIEEASEKLNDPELIEKAHKHLAEMDKDKFAIDCFIKSIVDSKAYQDLPSPFLFL
jgi:hypothetical protein